MTEVINHEERSHSELGGSSASRWSVCQGSVFLARTLPPQRPSDSMKEGTKAHEFAEICLGDFLNHKKNGTDPEIRFCLMTTGADPQMVDAAEGYKDAVWIKVLEQSITGKAFGLEEHFEFDKQLDMGGIVDFWCVYIDDRGMRVGAFVDFKYGYTPVEVKRNGQLAFYAVALRRYVREHGKDLDYVRTAIYQPRVAHRDPYQEAKLTSKQLDTWEKKFVKAAHQIYVKQKPIFKTGDQCIFCPSQAICPKYGKELSVKAELSIVEVDKVKLPEPEALTDQQLVNICLYGSKINAFIKSCQAFAINKHMMGNKLPGVKVVLGSTRRKWKDNEEEIAEAFQTMGIDPWNKKLKGLGDMKRCLRDITGEKGKAIDEMIDPYCTQTQAKPCLVPESDERPEVENALDYLADLADEEN